MNSITVFSPAKVNLYLQVLGKRSDGYHEIVTLFHRISLQDEIAITKTKRPGLSLITNHPKLKRPSENLIYKAYQALKRVGHWPGGVRVRLKKNIPVAAGLGGGSSNAAHFLLGMNKLFNLRLPKKTLFRLGSELGSDVPFFLYEVNQAIGTGRGEKIKPMPSRTKFWFVIVVPHFGISTALVYKRL